MQNPTVVDIMMNAIRNDQLRANLRSDFDATMQSMQWDASLSTEEYEALRGVYSLERHGHECEGCSYDMSCGMRGAYR